MARLYEPDSIAVSAAHWIDGEIVEAGGASATRLEVVRPSDGKVHAQLPLADADTVDRAVLAARRAAPAWAALKPRERGRLLIRFGELVSAHAEEIGRLESVVSSRVQAEAGPIDVGTAAEYLRFYGEYCDKLEGTITASGREAFSLVAREPHGVVAIITPWNFPVILSTWKVAPALAAGNTVVLKPSEMTPFSMVRIAQLAIEAGIPAGVFNVVQGDGPVTGKALTTHPDVDYVTFTGSSQVGGRIMADIGASGIKPVALELGGKGAQLVFADCGPLDTVADHVTWGVTRNAGQLCYAGSRLVVHEAIADELVERVRTRMLALRPGATWDDATTLAPIISRKQVERMTGIVERALAAGAECLTGGEAFEQEGGQFFAPTMLAGVRPGMEACDEEIFGPVLTVETFADEEEGIALARAGRYGLSASVFSRDIERALAASRRLDAGTVWVNRWGRTAEMMTAPFGGFGRSGFGKEAGRQGIEGFSRQKAIWIDFAKTPDLAHSNDPRA
ncbi:aldehyde dehydrogenase [Novosphingobium sp. YJ-S2-02]|uniref:Aldehyde dehydrogenase n=1 Tax=Novosphingobium aureum TaxID=2792964 RepID=A0A931MLV6_9SPHN|nr:aldehyde dehydrogenase family protein [Novosphingobium aureum]MBH0114472.1 aldehyde dehydrogenase [Novosphingobium aureum]